MFSFPLSVLFRTLCFLTKGNHLKLAYAAVHDDSSFKEVKGIILSSVRVDLSQEEGDREPREYSLSILFTYTHFSFFSL